MKNSHIYIDCTHTYVFGGNSGIQRVVRNIANSLRKEERLVTPVVYHFGRYVVTKKVPEAENFLIDWLRRVKRIIGRNYVSDAQGNQNIPAKLIKISKICSAIISATAYPSLFFRRRVVFRPGDIFFVADNFWTNDTILHLTAVKKSGATIGFLLYDIIPLTRPEYFQSGLGETFRRRLSELIALSDFCITISEAVKKEFSGYVMKDFPHKKISIYSWKPGIDIDVFSRGVLRQKVGDLFTTSREKNPFIMVSTIEPRKGHDFVLDAFESMWNFGSTEKLCLIGKIGWSCSALVNRINNHAELGRRLFVFHDVGDYELFLLYERAQGLIMASRTEGLGLPIVEALTKKCPVYASDIPVFREVGGKFCSYFDFTDPTSLVTCLMHSKKTSLAEWEKNNEFRWPTKGESATSLVNIMVEYL